MKIFLRKWRLTLLWIVLWLASAFLARKPEGSFYAQPLLVASQAAFFALNMHLVLKCVFHMPATGQKVLNSFLLFMTYIQISGVIAQYEVLYVLHGVLLPFIVVIQSYRTRFIRLMLMGSVLFIVNLLSDMCGSIALTAILGPDGFAAMRDPMNLMGVMLCNTVVHVFMAMLTGIYVLVRYLLRRVNVRNSLSLRVLRPIALLAVTIFIYITVMSRTSSLPMEEALGELVYSYSLCILMVVISISYIYQDVNAIHLIRRMETLEQKQRINDALILNLRTFRHNVANMLYGLEGVMLSGTPEDLRQYYDELVARCSMINNENIVMLENVHEPAVSALLLRHLGECNAIQCPMEIYTEKDIRLSGIPPVQLCEVLGVLLDNAREAALQCDTPQILVEIRKVGAATEVVIRNTFDMDTPPQFAVTTKPGHEGVGLRSIHAILRRYKRIYFNLRLSGRYVEAQLLME